jgi:hypothetical protein
MATTSKYKPVKTEQYPFLHVIAHYTSKGREYAGNRLIEALPRFPKSLGELQNKLNVLPKFSKALRQQSGHKRRMALRKLARFFIATSRVYELAEFIYSEVLQGYVHRAPNSPEANRIMQHLYLKGKIEKASPFGGTAVQFSSALTGIPGAGKSIAAAQIERLFPPIIFHPELNIWQIPILRIQMPYHGKRDVNLASAIIAEIDRRYPPGGYRRIYLDSPRADLMGDAQHLLAIHCVGLLLVDDAQQSGVEPLEEYDGGVMKLPKRPRTPVYWAAGLLFDASNTIHFPLLFIATAELEQVLGKTMSKLRRAYGNGLPHWDPLDAEILPGGRKSEYDVFMNVLWSESLLRNHPKFNASFRNIFHFYTFGIPDFIVKLYYALQLRMLWDNKETFTLDDIHFVAAKCLEAIIRLTRKMRRLAESDPEAQSTLALMTEMAAEFKLKAGVSGVKHSPTESESKIRKESTLPPPTGRAKRARSAQDRPSDLVQPETSDASQIGAGP